VNITHTFKNLGHPLDKIFACLPARQEGIPAGSSLAAVHRGFHPRFSEALQPFDSPT